MSATEKAYNPDTGGQPVTVERQGTLSRRIPLSLLVEPPDAMRHDMNDAALSELMDSIREVGILQSLCVIPVQAHPQEWKPPHNYEHLFVRIGGSQYWRVVLGVADNAALDAHEHGGGLYMVRAGHRRLVACRGINLNLVKCEVFCSGDVSEKSIMAHENAFREEPSDYDLAVMYREWMTEPNLTEDALRRRAGKSIDFIYARVEILNGWQEVANALHERRINFAVARELNRVEDEPYMRHFLNMAQDQGATGKLVRAWVNEHKAVKDMSTPAGPAPPPGITVTAPMQSKIECIVCGDTQSYNLRSVLMCHADAERIKEIRAAADNAPPEEAQA